MKDRIRAIRKYFDLTQQEFADRLGIKRGAIANYERGRNNPVDSVVSLICREFGVNEEWLRNGTGGPDNMFVPKMNDRIRQVRRELSLTQTEFAERIGMKQNSIALIESGKRNISNQAILSICREYCVNEKWLRTGAGDKMLLDVNSELAALVKKYNLSIADQLFIEKYVSMKPSSRRAIIDFVVNVAAALDDADANGKQENIYADIPDTPEELEQKYLLKDHEKGGGLG